MSFINKLKYISRSTSIIFPNSKLISLLSFLASLLIHITAYFAFRHFNNTNYLTNQAALSISTPKGSTPKFTVSIAALTSQSKVSNGKKKQNAVIKHQNTNKPAESLPTQSTKSNQPTVSEQNIVSNISSQIEKGLIITYPSISRKLGEEGTVIIQLLFNKNSIFIGGRIFKSSGYSRLDSAALEAVNVYIKNHSGTTQSIEADNQSVMTTEIKIKFHLY